MRMWIALKTEVKSYFHYICGINYRIFKVNFGFEQYLVSLPIKQQIFLMQIRTRNHRLPSETGRWQSIQREERICNLCQAEIGDGFHYMLVCKELQAIIKQHLSRYYYVRPNTMKFSELFNTRSKTKLRKLCAFICMIFSTANTREVQTLYFL